MLSSRVSPLGNASSPSTILGSKLQSTLNLDLLTLREVLSAVGYGSRVLGPVSPIGAALGVCSLGLAGFVVVFPLPVSIAALEDLCLVGCLISIQLPYVAFSLDWLSWFATPSNSCCPSLSVLACFDGQALSFYPCFHNGRKSFGAPHIGYAKPSHSI